MRLFRRRKTKKEKLSFEEILIESSNLPSFNMLRMEGRIEKPISARSIYMVGAVFVLIALAFAARLGFLQVVRGESYALQSAENSLRHKLIVAERGVIYDRTGEPLAWNELDHSGAYDFPVRAYTDRRGLGQFIGYVSYPQKDSSGVYYRTEYKGRSGIEEAYNALLQGRNGTQLVETTAHGEVISEGVIERPTPGTKLVASIDAALSEAMHDLIATTTVKQGFRSGAGAIMDVHTGELLALTSYPSYDPEVLADGDDVETIASYNTDERFPFLNKIIGGAYTPGSIVKPFVAYGALVEDIIDPMKIIVSNGQLVLPNPYDPDNPSIFKDWRVQGPMTMRDAIAFSSNVYFFTIGGGFEDQEGLGITRLYKYFKKFALGDRTGIPLGGEIEGVVPNPEWKQETFDDDWRLGDTYNTSIGQFGFLVTPIQMLRAYAAIANGGTLVTPQVLLGSRGDTMNIDLDTEKLKVVTEGMRRTVIQERGTARALERSDIAIAAKSGTAELGASKSRVNSWISGYFPYENPQYVFILFMEDGPRANRVGASTVMGKVFDWMAENRPEYLELVSKPSEL